MNYSTQLGSGKIKAIYVITTPDRFPNKIFKIGRTTQSQEDLRKRYKTSLIEPIILSYLPVADEVKSEEKLHNALKTYKLSNSEWYQCELGLIMTEICRLQIYEEAKEVTEYPAHTVPIDYERKNEFRKLYYWLTHDSTIIFDDFFNHAREALCKRLLQIEKGEFLASSKK